MKNVLYFNNINQIGGIETQFYMLAKKYNDWDITVYYKTGDEQQISRLCKYVRVRKYTPGETIRCEKAFFNYNIDIIENVEADEYIQFIHADYVELYKTYHWLPNTHPKITRYVAVSKQAAKAFKEMTGIEAEVCYNPLVLEKPKKILHLITASRLTKEKGKDRMIKLAKILDEANVNYIWTVFTNDTNAIDNPNIAYMKPRLDILNYIADADYLVQLSDTEAYSYSLIESLSLGTPVIVTDIPVLPEMGIIDGKNAFVLDFNLKNVPVEKIVKGLPKFEYKPNEDRWCELMAKGKTTYKPQSEENVNVKCIVKYFDLKLDRVVKIDEVVSMPKGRAEELAAFGYVVIQEAEV